MHRFSSTRALLAACLVALSAGVCAQQAPSASVERAIRAAMDGSIRPPEERARDTARLPVEILSFFRLREDQRVIEVLPAGGWFTKILAPVLADKGKLYVTHPEGFYAEAYRKIRTTPGLEKVEEIPWGSSTPASNGGPFGPSGRWNVAPVDLAVTFRNYHNFSPADRATVNRSTFDALKPGGYYGIVDHTRRHNEPVNGQNRRRVDPVQVIREVQEAGFLLVDSSDLYYRPDDALSLEVANPAVNDKTDRVALLFRKPEARR